MASLLRRLRRSSSSSGQTTSSTTKHSLTLKSDVDLNAGSALLLRYEKHFVDLHDKIEDASGRAEIVGVEVESLHARFARQERHVCQFFQAVAQLPDVTAQLFDTQRALGACLDLCRDVELGLDRLEDVCHESDLQANMTKHRLLLVEHKKRHAADLAKMTKKLEKEYADRQRARADSKRRELADRRRQLDEAFRTDVKLFQGGGGGAHSPPRLSPNAVDTEAAVEARLSSVTVDSDEAERRSLEQFLGDAEKAEEGRETPDGDVFVDTADDTTEGVAIDDASAVASDDDKVVAGNDPGESEA